MNFYKYICNQIKKSGLAFNICYLSTNITPKDRKERIRKIKIAIKNKERIIIVSTQLIEAGVDIDCDCVFRDWGPLDSIIQVAGRCNRNKNVEQSEVHLLNLIKENGNPYTSIYDPDLIRIVEAVLNGRSQVEEIEFLSLINDYFTMAKEKSRVETKLINSIFELYYDDNYANMQNKKRMPISSFQLIADESYKKQDVFVELDEKAKFIWKDYRNIVEGNYSSIEKKLRFLRIKKQFYEYVVSIDEKKTSDLIDHMIGEIIYIPSNERDTFYNSDTGFKNEGII